MKRLGIYLPDELYEQLRKSAFDKRISMSSLLVSFIPGITVERIESKDIQTKINVETCKHGFTKTYCNVKNCTFYASWR